MLHIEITEKSFKNEIFRKNKKAAFLPPIIH